MSKMIYVGVDLGGTTVKVGLCDRYGKLLHTYEGATESDRGAEAVLDNVEQYVRRFVSDSGHEWEQIAGIGAGIPGFMDIPQGFVKLSSNLGWRNVPVKDILESKFGKTVKIDNDANVAALGEAWSGGGTGVSHVVFYTLGTGVGGGIIIRGNLYQGFKGLAGELGHLKVVPNEEALLCGCGKKGCLETVSSATGIIQMAKEAVSRNESTVLSQVPDLKAKDVFEAAKQHDETALRIVDRAAMYLGKSMAAVSVVINPERFVIGGGVSKAGDFLFEKIRHYYKTYTVESAQEGVKIVPAALGNDAGMVGAAGLILFT